MEVKQKLNSENKDEKKSEAFIRKWLNRFNQKLQPAPVALRKKYVEKNTPPQSFSLKIAAILNWLNLPLFWLGVLVGVWLILDLCFIFIPGLINYATIKGYGDRFLAVAGPAAVGYWTNWLAIKMLFYPKRNNAVWWGLIPARKEELIELMAKNILERLISPEIISEYLRENRVLKKLMYRTGKALRETINEPEFRDEIKEIVSAFLSNFFSDPLNQDKICNSINEKINQWTKISFKGKLLEWTRKIWEPFLMKSLPELPEAINGFLDHIDAMLDGVPEKLNQEKQYFEAQLIELIIRFLHNIDLKKVIKSQFHKMNTDQFEAMISGNVRTELVFIQTSGGIFGLLVGLAVIYPVIRLVLLILGIGLWLVYRMSLKYSD
jgi:uncharacterized membrane-anchored protein YjiN (DUF445 family)